MRFGSLLSFPFLFLLRFLFLPKPIRLPWGGIITNFDQLSYELVKAAQFGTHFVAVSRLGTQFNNWRLEALAFSLSLWHVEEMEQLTPEFKVLALDDMRQHPRYASRYLGSRDDLLLRDSIRKLGLLATLVVHRVDDSESEYRVIDGNRRYDIARELGIETAFCAVYPPISEKQYELLRFEIQETVKPWTKSETEYVLRRMREFGVDHIAGTVCRCSE